MYTFTPLYYVTNARIPAGGTRRFTYTVASPTNAIANSTDTTNTANAAPFAINIGNEASVDNVVAWIGGESKSDNVVIGPIGANFCSPPFNLPGQSGSFTFEGCGGTVWVNLNGNLFATCSSFSEDDACGISTFGHCV
ncbi:hypothetical protein D9758_017897 [Tetrapyrgos nigripes]|uniref:Uncharacterized protein n=1 Tax=Tetrapyrgos nigripes TaxID=182062 RepID=A0A8H5C0Y8_9AGAR|nr:hypothetical protein D9758_017897 [Tetrapyrgos nigripes]